MSDPIKVSILGDDLFCQSMRALLETTSDIVVVSEANDGQEAITLIRETRPGVILLDVSTSRAGGLQTVGQICELFPQIKVIVLDDDSEEQFALKVLRRGALGCLGKKAQPAEIVKAIRAVSRGEAVLSPGVAGRILDKIVQEQQIKRQ